MTGFESDGTEIALIIESKYASSWVGELRPTIDGASSARPMTAKIEASTISERAISNEDLPPSVFFDVLIIETKAEICSS